jgi:hypothetical protein
MKEGKFLKGYTPIAARRYATQGFQEGQEAKFQQRERSGHAGIVSKDPGTVPT